MADLQNINLENIKSPEMFLRVLEAMYTEITALRTLANELRTDHATTKATVDAARTAIIELIDDHATFKTVVDELTAWAEALATKLNADAGVTDVDYDAIITADAPATLTATAPAAGPATLSAAAAIQKCQAGK